MAKTKKKFSSTRNARRAAKKMYSSPEDLFRANKLAVSDYHNSTAQFFSQRKEFNGPATGMYYIEESCNETSMVALQLLKSGHNFDALVLARTVLEGTLQLIKMLISSGDFVEETKFFKDYHSALLAHEKTKWDKFGETFNGDDDLSEILRLGERKQPTPHYIADAQKENSRSKRKPLIREWSTGEILRSLEREGKLQKELYELLRSSYNMLSHIAHADPLGLRVRFEQMYVSGNRENKDVEDWRLYGFQQILLFAQIRHDMVVQFQNESQSFSKLPASEKANRAYTKIMENGFLANVEEAQKMGKNPSTFLKEMYEGYSGR